MAQEQTSPSGPRSDDAKDCVLRYGHKGRVLAVASIYRDLDNLKAELAMGRGMERDDVP
jgi:hypothetical protein